MSTTPRVNEVLSHWYRFNEGLQASSLELYQQIEAAVQKRNVPDIKTERVLWKEGGVLSADREYLRVTRGRLIFDICAAPFGNGYFVSWWLARAESNFGSLALLCLTVGLLLALVGSWQAFGFLQGLAVFVVGGPISFWALVKFMNSSQDEGWDDPLVAMPIVGSWYERIFRPETYYKMDTALMFQESIRGAVNEVYNELTGTKGIRALTEQEEKPILKRLAASAA